MANKYLNLLKTCFQLRSLTYLSGRLLELVLGYPLLLLSYCMPRQKNKWLFGTNVGFIDNAKYLFIYINEQHKEILPIWISINKRDVERVRSLGLKAYRKYSLGGIWHSLTGYIYIFTYHSKDINYFTSGRAKKVNLWHGVGIKGGDGGKKGNNFSSKSNTTLLTKILFPHLYERNTLFLSTSDMMDKHFIKMFSLEPSCVFDAIYPRCYYMCKGKGYMGGFVEKYEGQDMQHLVWEFTSYKRVFLYMPTWRGNLRDDFIQSAGFDFDRLNTLMEEKNYLFILKLHPAVRVEQKRNNGAYSNLLFLDKKLDVYPILPFIDVLITDYSSIYYDFILLDRGIILYPFDKENFLDYSNNLAFDYDEYTPGYRVMSIGELEVALLSDNDFRVIGRDRIINAFWGKAERNDLESLYNQICSL